MMTRRCPSIRTTFYLNAHPVLHGLNSESVDFMVIFNMSRILNCSLLQMKQ